MVVQSQDENEKPAKVWQINELSSKIDTLTVLVTNKNDTYYSKDEINLLLEKQQNKNEATAKTVANIVRVVWVIVGTVTPIAVATVWQLVVNNARVG